MAPTTLAAATPYPPPTATRNSRASTYERNGDRRSRVVLNLTPGNIVTAPRSDMMFVVTKFGLVNLKGKSIPKRAKAMISLLVPARRATGLLVWRRRLVLCRVIRKRWCPPARPTQAGQVAR
jgi:hypothetical protein